MIGDLYRLEHKKLVAPIPVTLPNGARVMACLQGSIKLSPTINLDKVLYIPKFSCNLISMAQLICDLKCIVLFDNDLCVM